MLLDDIFTGGHQVPDALLPPGKRRVDRERTTNGLKLLERMHEGEQREAERAVQERREERAVQERAVQERAVQERREQLEATKARQASVAGMEAQLRGARHAEDESGSNEASPLPAVSLPAAAGDADSGLQPHPVAAPAKRRSSSRLGAKVDAAEPDAAVGAPTELSRLLLRMSSNSLHAQMLLAAERGQIGTSPPSAREAGSSMPPSASAPQLGRASRLLPIRDERVPGRPVGSASASLLRLTKVQMVRHEKNAATVAKLRRNQEQQRQLEDRLLTSRMASECARALGGTY